MSFSSPNDKIKEVPSLLVGKVVDSLITGVFDLAHTYITTQANHEGDETQKELESQLERLRQENRQQFQSVLFEQQKLIQKELLIYKHNEQLKSAAQQRETALQSAFAYKLVDNWPLRIVPAFILDSYHKDDYIPLRIINVPPIINLEQFGSAAKDFSRIDKYLVEGLRNFLHQHYSLNNSIRPVELLDGAWSRKRYHGGSSIKALFEMLKSEAILILESEIDGDYLNFRLGYWDLGQTQYSYTPIISRYPYRELIYESAKNRAQKWKAFQQKLKDMGQDPKEVNQLDSYNLEVLELEKILEKSGLDVSKLPRRYQVNHEDLETFAEFLLICNCLVAAWVADIHHLIQANVPPQLPQLLPELIQYIPDWQVIRVIVNGYQEIYQALEYEYLEQMPDMALELAHTLQYLPDKSLAKQQIDYSVKCWLKLRGITNLETATNPLELMHPLLTVADREYVEKLQSCLAEVEDEQTSDDMGKVLDSAAENPQFYYHSGLSHLNQYNYLEAIADFDKAIHLDADFALAYCDRALVLLKLGEVEAAVASYNQAVTINPDEPKILEYKQLFPASAGEYEFTTPTLNILGKEIKQQSGTAKFFTEDLGNDISLEMVAIPGGTFWMGSPEGEGYNVEKPQHKVTVPSFFMGKYPITQLQWATVAALPTVERDLKPYPSRFRGDNLPVEKVSWYDAVEFCARLSAKTGRNYRLPSEAEWEYAARAGTTTPFHFGQNITPDLANYDSTYAYGSGPKGISRKETTDVGSFPPNTFGLYDMHGLVWEWCADTWHENYVGAPNDGSIWEEQGNANRSPLRGGSWLMNPAFCRSAYRFNFLLGRNYINFSIGFRVVCVLGGN